MLTAGVCSEVGCPERATYRGKCPVHARAARRARHESTRAWRKLRAEAMARAGGVCERCGIRPAVDAHHMVEFCSRIQPVRRRLARALSRRILFTRWSMTRGSTPIIASIHSWIS